MHKMRTMEHGRPPIRRLPSSPGRLFHMRQQRSLGKLVHVETPTDIPGQTHSKPKRGERSRPRDPEPEAKQEIQNVKPEADKTVEETPKVTTGETHLTPKKSGVTCCIMKITATAM